VTAALLISHSWVVLAAVTAWLALASTLARDRDREVLRVGLLLAAVLAGGTVVASLLGGLGHESQGFVADASHIVCHACRHSPHVPHPKSIRLARRA
jgi:hypothetical protein